MSEADRGDETATEHFDVGVTRKAALSRDRKGEPLGLMVFVTAEELLVAGLDPEADTIEYHIGPEGLSLG